MEEQGLIGVEEISNQKNYQTLSTETKKEIVYAVNDDNVKEVTDDYSVSRKVENDTLINIIHDSGKTTKITNSQPYKKKKEKKKVMLSLDIVRGIAVILMIIVHSQPLEEKYYLLRHAKFNETVTPADFVFPLFLFVMGYTLGIMFSRRLPLDSEEYSNERLFGWCCWKIKMKKKNHILAKKWISIFQRSLFLFLIGLSINFMLFSVNKVTSEGVTDEKGVPSFQILFILQRISICYFSISVLVNVFRSFLVQTLFIFCVQSLYFLLVHAMPYKCADYVVGKITEDCSALTFFDQALGYSKGKYSKYGIVSTLGSISTTFYGYVYFKIAKALISKNRDDPEKAKYIIFANWIIFSVLLIITGFFFNMLLYRYNMDLWSISFDFLVSGTAGLFLSAIMYFIDIFSPWYLRCWFFVFVWVGINPLINYFLPMFIQWVILGFYVDGKTLFWYPAKYLFATWMDEKLANIIYAVLFELIFILLAGLMYHYKIFVKLWKSKLARFFF